MSGVAPDPSEIVPDDVDAEELHRRVQAQVGGGGDRRCPECGRKGLRATPGGYNVQVEHDYRCRYPDCAEIFDTEEVDGVAE